MRSAVQCCAELPGLLPWLRLVGWFGAGRGELGRQQQCRAARGRAAARSSRRRTSSTPCSTSAARARGKGRRRRGRLPGMASRRRRSTSPRTWRPSGGAAAGSTATSSRSGPSCRTSPRYCTHYGDAAPYAHEYIGGDWGRRTKPRITESVKIGQKLAIAFGILGQ